MDNNRNPDASAWAGWVVFAGTMLVVLGAFNIVEGIIALLRGERIVIAQDRLIAVNLTGWGWTLLIFGVVMVAAGLGLFTASPVARVTAIVIVSLHAIAQLGWLSAYPVWSLLMIGLDTVVLFALTARWSVAARELDDGYETVPREARTGQHASY